MDEKGQEITIRRSTPSEILQILRSGNFESIIGVREDARIEFKRELNLKLDSERHKLAKAVSSLANTAGGVVLIGVGISRDPITRADYASEITFASVADEAQYYKALSDFLYPLAKVTTHVHGNPPSHLVAIEVENAAAEAPILVTKTIGESLNGGNIFGYYRRTELGSDASTYAEMHALLQTGQRLAGVAEIQGALSEIVSRIAAIEESLRTLRDDKA